MELLVSYNCPSVAHFDAKKHLTAQHMTDLIFLFTIISLLLLCRHLPREVDPLVYNMSIEDPGDVSYNQIGGLGEQIRELREVKHQISN